MGEHKIWALEVKHKLLSGKTITEVLLAGQPRHIIENNIKAWGTLDGQRKFKLIRITKHWEV